jgi:hypothetical protein
LAPGLIYRCGRIDGCTAADLLQPKVILNLRVEHDTKDLAGVNYLHIPADNTLTIYETDSKVAKEVH